MWLLFALASTAFYSLRRLSEKKLSGKADHFTLGWAVQALSLPVVTVFLFFADIPTWQSLGASFWVPLVIIWFVLYPSQAYFYYQSLRQSNASKVLPLMSFVPIFTVVLSLIINRELPSIIGLMGIFSIVAGVYIRNLAPGMKLFAPLLHLVRDKPSLFMLINSFSVALGTTLDKVAVHASNPLFYSFINTLGGAIVLSVIAYVWNKKFIQDIKRNYRGLLPLGLFQGFGATAYMIAISTGLAAYVIAIKNANVVVAALLGVLALKEVFKKSEAIALGLILIGIAGIAFG